MLSQELRPNTWNEMAGQKENIKILKAIIKDPDHAPKCLIFSGAFGSGKSTSARILARELNKLNDDYVGDTLLSSKFYEEYDSTIIGNIDMIRRLRDDWTINYGEYYRVIVLDETHAVSQSAQTALLKVFEETQGRIFFVMCTTEPNKLLPTIRSRSLELQFNPVPTEDIVKNIEKVTEERNISVSHETIRLIADRADGHMRNAHMLLDKYILLGEQDFRDSVKSSVSLYCDYLIAIYDRNEEKVLETLNDLMNVPKDNLHSDWNTVMTESLKSFCGFEIKHEDIKLLVSTYKSDFQYVSSCYMSVWIKNAFIDMPNFQATMLNLYLVLSNALKKKDVQTQQTQSNIRSNSRYGTPVR